MSRQSNGPRGPGFYESHFLPDPKLREQSLHEPPLSIELTPDEMRDIQKVTPDLAVAATFFGPDEQDKNANEDFALTALIEGDDGELWTFATVADGVSTKTFWPARSSRLSCLVAFKTVRSAVKNGRCSEEADLKELRKRLVFDLRQALLDDQKLLNREKVLPYKWTLENYQQFVQRNDLWYNSTLLIACLGPKAGFLTWAGDGGIQVLKKPSGEGADVEVLTPLQSIEDLTVNTFVSLDIESSHFCVGRITYPAPSGTVEVYLASDGVDRTLQRSSMDYRELTLSDPHQAHQLLQGLMEKPQREVDNYSVAWLRNPKARILTPRVPKKEKTQVETPTWSEPQLEETRQNTEEPAPEKPEPTAVKKPFVARMSRTQRVWVSHGLSFVLGLLVGLLLMRAFTTSAKPTAGETAPPPPTPTATPDPGAGTPPPKPSTPIPPQASPTPAETTPADTGTPPSTAPKPEATTPGKGKAKALARVETTDPDPRDPKIPAPQATPDPGRQEAADPAQAEGKDPTPPAPGTPIPAAGNETPPAPPQSTAPQPTPTAPEAAKQDPKTGGHQ